MEGGPCGAGDEVAVNDGFGHGAADVFAAGESYVRTGGGVGAAFLPFQNSRSGENLRSMADGGDGFIGLCEMVDDFDDSRVEAEIFGRAASGDHESVVVFRFDSFEAGVESEIVAALFGVSLIALEIVNAGGDELAGFFAGTNGVDGVAHHLKRFKGHHHFVVFDVIADEHENRFLGHGVLPEIGGHRMHGKGRRLKGSKREKGRQKERKKETVTQSSQRTEHRGHREADSR